ncbi:hypothetical protein Q8A64_18070 [Oxalobacteraceae bacterium R-40]|uniref:Mobile element protein n=1 Tax=Keguizhuia sedimenti TaxID=3064264 RepID=A0ABU1BTG1_9BURK|nr:hypothetical protein [Oxalobacteraceae bacterium R-40]
MFKSGNFMLLVKHLKDTEPIHSDPKGANLSAYTQAQLNAVAMRLNEHPRKTYTTKHLQSDSINPLPPSVESIVIADNHKIKRANLHHFEIEVGRKA